MQIFEVLGGDPNDYTVTLRVEGDSTSPTYVDEVSFVIAGIKAKEYTSVSLTSAPTSGATWIQYFDNVSASSASCVSDTGQQNAVCAQSVTGPGQPPNYGALLVGAPLEWTFYINLAPGVTISGVDALNLRAQFLNSDGTNAGILSPNGTRTPRTTTVPEPGSLVLLGLGVLGIVFTRRKHA